MPNKPIALIFNGVWSQYAVAMAPKYRDLVELVYVHDLERVSLVRWAALIVPFQSDHQALARHRDSLYAFLATGKKIAVFGDSAHWIDADWADRPVNNYWWREQPLRPPIAHTRFDHPLFAGLTERQACWHHHGVYTRLPPQAEVLQQTEDGEVIAWQTTAYGGVLLAATSDPIVEHGVQQIQHLDHFVDQLMFWLCGVRPSSDRMTVDASAYGKPFRRFSESDASAVSA